MLSSAMPPRFILAIGILLSAAMYLARKPLVTAATKTAKAIVRMLSASGLALIKAHEGLELFPYADVAGHMTIGYGHLIMPGENFSGGISEHQAETILRADTEKAQRAVRVNVTVPLTQNQFDALVSLVFNIGIGAFTNSTLLRVLNEGRYADAAAQFDVWRMAGKRVVQGLVKRRAAERDLFSR